MPRVGRLKVGRARHVIPRRADHLRRHQRVGGADDPENRHRQRRHRLRIRRELGHQIDHVLVQRRVERHDLVVEEGQRWIAVAQIGVIGEIRDPLAADAFPRARNGGDSGGGQAAGRAAHQQRRDPLGVLHRRAQAGPAAHRLRDQRRPLDLQLIEQRNQIVHERPRAGTALPLHAAPPAAVIEHDAAVGLGEDRRLLPPGEVIAAAPVGEHNRRPVAGRFVVQVAGRPEERRHGNAFRLIARYATPHRARYRSAASGIGRRSNSRPAAIRSPLWRPCELP